MPGASSSAGDVAPPRRFGDLLDLLSLQFLRKLSLFCGASGFEQQLRISYHHDKSRLLSRLLATLSEGQSFGPRKSRAIEGSHSLDDFPAHRTADSYRVGVQKSVLLRKKRGRDNRRGPQSHQRANVA